MFPIDIRPDKLVEEMADFPKAVEARPKAEAVVRQAEALRLLGRLHPQLDRQVVPRGMGLRPAVPIARTPGAHHLLDQ